MTSFPDFLSTFDPDAGKRGKQFEHFVKWFLKNDPEWETQVDDVWLWSDYPGQWGRFSVNVVAVYAAFCVAALLWLA
jgi:predicted helicase